MSLSFDPYRDWLGLSAGGAPRHHYWLLGLEPFEDDVERVAAAADHAVARIHKSSAGSQSETAARLLDEVAAARAVLVDPLKKAAYDRALRGQLQLARTRSADSHASSGETADDGPAPSDPNGTRSDPRDSAKHDRTTSVLGGARLIVASLAVALIIIVTAVVLKRRPADSSNAALSPSLHQPAEPAPAADTRLAPTSRDAVWGAKDSATADPPPSRADETQSTGLGSSASAGDLGAADEPPASPRPADQTISANQAPDASTPTSDATRPAPVVHPDTAVHTSADWLDADPTYVPARGSPDSGRAIARAVHQMFHESWTQRTMLGAAAEHFEAAQALNPADPRPGYAYGLILLKHYRYDDAAAQFDAAAQRGQLSYLPAQRAAIWLRFLRDDYVPGLAAAVSLVETLDPNSASNAVRESYADWLGRLMGYLEGPAQLSSLDALRQERDAEIRSRLAQPHWAIYDSAKQSVLESYAERLAARDETRELAKQQQERELAEGRARIAEERGEVAEQQKQLEMSATQWEDWIKQQIVASDAQWNRLSQDYDRAASNLAVARTALGVIDADIARLRVERDTLPADDTQGRQRYDFQIVQLSRNRFVIEQDVGRFDAALRSIQGEAAVVMRVRQNAVQRYQAATGKLYKESKSLASRDRLLGRVQNELARPASGSTTHVRAKSEVATALRTYVDFNLEAEKRRLLESFHADKSSDPRE